MFIGNVWGLFMISIDLESNNIHWFFLGDGYVGNGKDVRYLRYG